MLQQAMPRSSMPSFEMARVRGVRGERPQLQLSLLLLHLWPSRLCANSSRLHQSSHPHKRLQRVVARPGCRCAIA